MNLTSKIAITVGGSAVILVATVIALWLWVVSSTNPLDQLSSAHLPWPVVCTTSGCVTTLDWHRLHNAAETFASASNSDGVSPAESVTTALRNFLVAHGSSVPLITPKDVERYQSDVLQLSEEQIRQATGMSQDYYRRYVIHPFLAAEALRQQRSAESLNNLYQLLASERLVVSLLWKFEYDRNSASLHY